MRRPLCRSWTTSSRRTSELGEDLGAEARSVARRGRYRVCHSQRAAVLDHRRRRLRHLGHLLHDRG